MGGGEGGGCGAIPTNEQFKGGPARLFSQKKGGWQ